MSMYAIDTLAFAKKLRNAGLSEEQADTIAEAHGAAFREAAEHTLATKTDLSETQTILKQDIVAVRAELKQDIDAVRAALKQDISAVRTELKQDIGELRTELKQDIAEVRTELHSLLRTQTFAIIGAVGALMALFQFIG